jgi:hypothetical protein
VGGSNLFFFRGYRARDGIGRLYHLFSSMLSRPVVDLAEALRPAQRRSVVGNAGIH